MITLTHLDFSDALLKIKNKEIVVHRYESLKALDFHIQQLKDEDKIETRRLCLEIGEL
jgi:hypothetical protein